jgi:hypothetical protein
MKLQGKKPTFKKTNCENKNKKPKTKTKKQQINHYSTYNTTNKSLRYL